MALSFLDFYIPLYSFYLFFLGLKSHSGWFLLKLNPSRFLQQVVAVSGEQKPDMHWNDHLLQDLSNHHRALPCHSWKSHGKTFLPYCYHSPSTGWGSRWALPASQSEVLLFNKINILSDRKIFWCQPQGLKGSGGMMGKTERLVGWRLDINSRWDASESYNQANDNLGPEKTNYVIYQGFTRHIFPPFGRQAE